MPATVVAQACWPDAQLARRFHKQCLVRVRVGMRGSHIVNCGIVRKSQSVLIMIDPIITTRTRTHAAAAPRRAQRR
jgi:alkyl sulfatase BDS1-like metallo-beta-lactamase superfamily hydrolase